MNKKNQGFTLIELTLAIGFVAILLLVVATTTIFIGKIYQKGIALKTISQVGREASSNLQRDIADAHNGVVDYGSLGTPGYSSAASFRICTGNVSYLINNATARVNSGHPASIKDSNGRPITMVRVQDVNRAYCQKNVSGEYQLREVAADAKYYEIFKDSEVPLAVHNFVYNKYASSQNDKYHLHNIVLSVGTDEAGTIADGKCEPPSSQNGNFDNCAVSEFNLIARSGYGE